MKTWHILSVVGVLIVGSAAAAGLVSTAREAPVCKCDTACNCDPCQCPTDEGAAAACPACPCAPCTCADCGCTGGTCQCATCECANCQCSACTCSAGKCPAAPAKGCCGR